MKAILLAAGVGSRIAENIGNIPKSLMDVGGKPLIVHTVELLQKNGMDVVIITGFKHRMIEEALLKRGFAIDTTDIKEMGAQGTKELIQLDTELKEHRIKIYYNPFYAVTNSIGSLWYAREEFDSDEVFIANADVFYTQELLDNVFAADYDNFLLCDRSRAEKGDYFFLTENGILKKYGKQLTRAERNAEYVGIAVLKNDWVKKFRNRLCDMIEDGEYDYWWEDALYSFVDADGQSAGDVKMAYASQRGKRSRESAEDDIVHTVDVDGVFWSEIDTIEDYERVVEHCGKCVNNANA